jgi:two-component system, cell cycle sensor histidine kinase and response regulator CckA
MADAPEARSAEARQRFADKMEAVSRLAGGVAHQFNNLLTSILATADLALESKELPRQLRADLEDIREAGRRASAITRQLLAFSGSQSLAPHETDVNAVIAQLEPLLTHLMTPSTSLEIRPQSEGAIETDPVRLEQVILNLVANAVDAMPNGGTIRIHTDNVDSVPATETTSPAHAHTRISITDTGIGMDEQVRARVFEPFFSARGMASGGMGLGLASVYGTMQQLGGGVTVQSSLGQGTRVELYLPRWLTPAATPSSLPAVEGEIPAVPAEVVLVVEDEAIVRAPICRMLRSLGYFVLEANNGEDALLVMQEYHSPIHLVVTDVMMPEMDGPTLVAMLRDWYPRMKVLYISGYSDELIEERGGQIDGSAFLPKPFSLQVLNARVREILDTP